MAVSDPRSDSYGNHLSLEEVNTLTAPTQNAVVSIDRFLQQHGVTVCVHHCACLFLIHEVSCVGCKP
jgi:hypothetical protein